MSKYFLFFKNSIVEALIYRANVFLLLLSQIISLIFFMVLWQAIYSQNNQIGDYTLEGLVGYYLISSFLNFVVWGTDVAWWMADEINLGIVTAYLLKPIDYFWSTFSIISGKAFFKLVVSLILILLVGLGSSHLLDIFSDEKRLLFFAFSVLLAFLLFFCLFFLIGSLAFWFGLVAGFNFFMRTMIFFLSGAIIPLDLLPNFFFRLTKILPFQYLTWLPIQIFQGHLDLRAEIFYPVLGWLFFLFVLARFIFKKGVKKYEGFGA